ncbi:MAG: FAD-dependent oxidoreductase [bacterium]|nr:FAD-dependent oxidoreductase [bacterium]
MRTIIIGGGISGIAAARSLSQAGVQVTLLEARSHLGGRLSSYHSPSLPTPCDCGPHLFLSSYTHTRRLLRDLNASTYLKFPYLGRIPFIRSDGKSGALEEWVLPAPFNLAAGLLTFKLLSMSARRRVFTAARSLMALQVDSSQSAEEFLQPRSQSEELDLFWKPLIRAALNAPLDQVSLKDLKTIFAEGFCQGLFGSRLGYATTPLGTLFSDRSLQALQESGVEVHLKSPVASLDFESNQAVKVRLKNSLTLTCDALILALPPWAMNSISATSPELQQALAAYHLSDWRAHAIASIYLWADNRPQLDGYTCLPGRTAGWIFDFARLWNDPRAPLCLMLENSSNFTASQAQVEEIVKEAFQAIPQLRVVRWTRTKWICERRATVLHPRQLWGVDLPQTTSIPNLFLSGDWLEPLLPPTVEAAVRSGQRAVELLKAKLT